jgi:hypothetical protein
MTMTEIIFSISGTAVCGDDGIVQNEELAATQNLLGRIAWVLSQNLNSDTLPIAVLHHDELGEVDQQQLHLLMKKYKSHQLKMVYPGAVN